jgi:hypothetical protein
VLLGDAPAYFRITVHELGHAMGLRHNDFDNGFMNPTDAVAASATPDAPFPQNMPWRFAPDDRTACGIGPTFWYAQPVPTWAIPLRRRVASRLRHERALRPARHAGSRRSGPAQPDEHRHAGTAQPEPKAGLVRGRVIAAGVARTFLPFLVSTLGVPLCFEVAKF